MEYKDKLALDLSRRVFLKNLGLVAGGRGTIQLDAVAFVLHSGKIGPDGKGSGEGRTDRYGLARAVSYS